MLTPAQYRLLRKMCDKPLAITDLTDDECRTMIQLLNMGYVDADIVPHSPTGEQSGNPVDNIPDMSENHPKQKRQQRNQRLIYIIEALFGFLIGLLLSKLI